MEEDGKAFKKPKTNGRPPSLKPEVQTKIINAIKAGNYMETAARYAGISKAILYVWLKKGHEQKSGIYKKFLDAVEEALAISEMVDVQNISAAAKMGNWQASAWRLERKFSDRWGRQERVDLNHSGSIGVKIVDDIPQETEPEDD